MAEAATTVPAVDLLGNCFAIKIVDMFPAGQR